MANSDENIADISRFLEDFHHRRTVDPRLPFSTVPRTAVPDHAQPIASEYDTTWDQDSASYYTTNTRSSRTYSARSPSVFTQSGYGAPSSVGQSTAPVSRAPTYAGVVGNVDGGNNDLVLWCEFRELSACQNTFRYDDVAGWIDHHAQHLNNKFPAELVCWFCDDHPRFVAKRIEDRQYFFEARMEHIREHIRFGDVSESGATRPDFFMMSHLYKYGYLDRRTFEYVMKYNELPLSLQLPIDGKDWTSRHGHAYDHEKEERQRRKQQGKKRAKKP